MSAFQAEDASSILATRSQTPSRLSVEIAPWQASFFIETIACGAQFGVAEWSYRGVEQSGSSPGS
ncbi:MAG: hypothetical protein UV82_C0010G0018 [Candidatus Magasanikbacteria bacterium GW2011_GWD2_43_18]|uniref:Uncharacterized protein n=1 Tax=Candidatus Magasanikbacteria bacterium GW2011_GWE2_42_7 TaxID=1619052 RepID=A0A0G1EB11_9BACT|nr:MAG: hypothetical protein UV18_C0005G0166 [Candidatus Magasanikbacteria bacterium GW2011_GWC2_42_27]KKS71783.1 MAG: hypothetical protein UV42_C0019G0007 [Candidatus Magasanikbacteria bacterium GW2011_GWE2_42_7]KKT04202.1 MAG: hypothetical protein UV82_C0010G0018 [Candidatus Magasanikbacteria bacterium GW2011_GWD2_43_18]KKT25896.1 MAG: hypothetical protein UW10_C0003G0057 [Candidatus Magasanikbacteria bacterium GW2011_GWA2_43_9]